MPQGITNRDVNDEFAVRVTEERDRSATFGLNKSARALNGPSKRANKAAKAAKQAAEQAATKQGKPVQLKGKE
jgi:hypothetical protein